MSAVQAAPPTINAPRLTSCPAQHDGDRLYQCDHPAGHRDDEHETYNAFTEQLICSWPNACLYCSKPLGDGPVVYVGDTEAPCAHFTCWREDNTPIIPLPATLRAVVAYASKADDFAETCAVGLAQLGADHYASKAGILRSLLQYLTIFCRERTL